MGEEEKLSDINKEIAALRLRLAELEEFEVIRRSSIRRLTKSESRYKYLFNSVGDAIFVHYPTPDGIPGKFIEINDIACRMLGYSRDELYRLTFMDISELSSSTLESDQAIGILKKEVALDATEAVFISKDGRRIPVELSVRMFNFKGRKAILTRAWDISRRKNAEQKAHESEKKYQLLFNSGNDLVFVQRPTHEGMPGRFIEVNDAACQVLGYTRDEFFKKTPLEITDVSSWVAEPAEAMKMLARGKRILNETTFFTKDGGKIPVEVTIRMFDFQGGPAVLTLARDIRERKKLEELKRKNEQRLRKMAAACIQAQEQEREVISMEVHDRSLQMMLSIYQHIDRLDSLVPPDSKEQKLTQNLLGLSKDAIGEIRNIMKDLYPDTLAKFGLISLMDDELHRFKKDSGCQCKLDTHCPKRLPRNIETTIYRVFHEALMNIKRHAANVCSINVSLVCENGNVELVVSDDGPGFNVKHNEKRGVPGGLTSMRRRTEIIGGSFRATSTLGKGTTIRIKIPVARRTSKNYRGKT